MTANDPRFRPGQLVRLEYEKTFPVVLREGPGYTFERCSTMASRDVCIVIESKLGHGMTWWTSLLIGSNGIHGWIPENVLKQT